MTLTPLQLQLMEYSDKTLKFWTLWIANSSSKQIYKFAWYDKWWNTICVSDNLWMNKKYWKFDQAHKIIWNPFWRGRVCMLYHKDDSDTIVDRQSEIEQHFNKNPDLYDQNCLEWDDETAKLVLDFLNSLSINK